jgi:UDPglucose 6-dehydrogenase
LEIAVIGAGYVGLVTGTCFAKMGNKVTLVDIDSAKIKKLSRGKITIFEPGLEEIFQSTIKKGRLNFTTNLTKGVACAKIIFIALPTPQDADGSADLKFVLDVANKLGKIIKDYKVIVDKSTVPVGTADKVKEAISLNYSGEFDVVSNPEFLREGVAVDDFMNPNRVVIGTKSERARKLMRELYVPFLTQDNQFIFMDEKSAELTKYAANSFLATKISFMNEIAQLCEKLGADVDMVRKGIGSDDRIGNRYLFPGIGYGGSCFPKDVQALIKSADEVGYDIKILKAVESVNENQRLHLLTKIKAHFKGNLKGIHFAIWGLAFKPNTDDIREAPALYMIDALIKSGARITAFDPHAMPNVQAQIGDKIEYAKDQYIALEGADALIIATEWSEFRTPDFEHLNAKLKCKVIFDGRNIFNPDDIRSLGYNYISVGKI